MIFLQVLRQCCRVSRPLCEAAVVSGAPSALMASAISAKDVVGGGAQSALLALTALSAMLDGVTAGGRWGREHGPGANKPGSSGNSAMAGAGVSSPAALAALAPSSATDEAVKKLLGLMAIPADGDARLPMAAAGAVAAYLRSYLSPPQPVRSAANAAQPPLSLLRPVPPPSELLMPARLSAVVKLIKHAQASPASPSHTSSSCSLAMEAVEGVPCRTGLFDGVIALVHTVLAYGPGADASMAALQVSLYTLL